MRTSSANWRARRSARGGSGGRWNAGRSGDGPAAISRALLVGHILEGSVRTAGVRLRVTAKLTDVARGCQLWSERFDKDAIDVFAIQDEIAAGVVGAVKARLGPAREALVFDRRPTTSTRGLGAVAKRMLVQLQGLRSDMPQEIPAADVLPEPRLRRWIERGKIHSD